VLLWLGIGADRPLRPGIYLPVRLGTLCLPARLQPLVACALSLRPGRMGLALADLRQAPAHDPRSRLGDGCLFDPAGVLHGLTGRKRVDMLHAALDLAPHGVLAVEEAGIVEADEE